MSGMKAVSLFSGAGGMDIGVDRAGFHTVCAVEIDRHCVDTLAANQSADKPKEIVHADIREVNPAALMRKLGLRAGEVSLLCGSPPRYLLPTQKEKNDAPSWWSLMFELARFARVFRPRVVMLVQVPSVRSVENGRPIFQFKKELESVGFPTIVEDVVDAVDFGVPQNRKLYFCAAAGEGALPAAFEFPRGKARTVGDAIRGLPPPVLKGEEPRFPNHVNVTPPRDRVRISYVKEGSYLGNDDNDAPSEVRGAMGKKDTTKFRRTAWNLPARTLRSGEPFYHPEENRYLTPRESMRVHGFPDDYVLRGPIRSRSGRARDMDQNRQISGAVPPPLAEGLALQIRKALRR